MDIFVTTQVCMSMEKKSKKNEIDVDEAIKRMKTYSSKTRSVFGKNLKLKEPKSVYGHLAGPVKK